MTRLLTVLLVTAALALATSSHAQFSRPVVVLKGTVRALESGKPMVANVSVRVAGDTALEITSSRSNSLSGNYLVILQPGKKYWVHLQGDHILPKDTLVETPFADQTQQLVLDFTVTPREVEVVREAQDMLSTSPTMERRRED